MPDETKKKSSSKLDQLRDAERALRVAELKLVEEKTESVRLENETTVRVHALDLANEALQLASYDFTKSQDENQRTYNFIDDVNYMSATKAVKTVGAWARMSVAPIIVRFNSPGGSVFDGLALYDQLKAIDSHKTPIITVSMGMSASMAGILMQAGSKRLVAENTYFLVHEVSSGAYGKTSEMEDEVKFTRRLNDRIFRILSERSQGAFKAGTAKEGLTTEQVWEKSKRKDWWLDADEAVYFGFADEIGYL